MSTFNTVRAWKDEDYRLGLSQADLALLPEHPAGATELSDEQLTNVNGGTNAVAFSIVVAGVAIGLGYVAYKAAESVLTSESGRNGSESDGGNHDEGPHDD